MKTLFDTNMLIDDLRGIRHSEPELTRYDAHAISIVTWMAVTVGTSKSAEGGTRTSSAAST